MNFRKIERLGFAFKNATSNLSSILFGRVLENNFVYFQLGGG